MLLALLVLAGMSGWVPMRWHSGDPKSLALLDGTPVNCILLERSCQTPEIIREAASRRIVTLGVLHSSGERPAPGVNGVVLEGNFEEPVLPDAKMCVIRLPDRRRLRLASRDPILGTWQGLWPGIEIEHGGAVLAGPTSSPWINTNSGFLRFLRAATDATLWVGVTPPAGTVYPVERYLEAIGDAAIAGARWIVALDSDFERRLLARDPAALRGWQRIARQLAYFEEHREWRGYRPYSEFALVEDAGDGGLLSAGLLDLISVQHTPVRVIPRGRVNAESLRGVRVVLSVDPRDKPALAALAGSDATVLAPPSDWNFPPIPDGQITLGRRQLEQMEPLWEVAYSATARKNFGVRLFNVSSTLSTLLASADGRSLLVHLLNFTRYAGESITIHARGAWRRARLYQPESEVQELAVYPIPEGTGVDIERMGVLASVRLDQ